MLYFTELEFPIASLLGSVCTETYRGEEIRIRTVERGGKQDNLQITTMIIRLFRSHKLWLGHGKWVSNLCENTNGDLIHKLYHDFTIFTTTCIDSPMLQYITDRGNIIYQNQSKDISRLNSFVSSETHQSVVTSKYLGYHCQSDLWPLANKVLWLYSLNQHRMMYPKAIGRTKDMSLFDWSERFHSQIKNDK